MEMNWGEWNSYKNQFEKKSTIPSILIGGNYSIFESKITIVILTHKRANTLVRALESAVNQKYDKKYAIIILDDYGAGDQETENLVNTYIAKYDNISYFRNQENLGQYAAWNRSVELSKTEWFCLLHDDDYLDETYLSTMDKVIHNTDEKAGLIGTYFHTVDERVEKTESKPKRALIDTLVDFFIRMRHGKPIEIGLKENINLIYVLSCCLLINKEKVMKIGGLDDQYYPSSDFALGSKMNCEFKTIFLPKYLSYRGIGENESLRMEVCTGAIECAYHQTMEMMKYLGYSNHKACKRANRTAVIAEIGVKGYHNVDYGEIKSKLGIPKRYNSKIMILLIGIYSKLCWGFLLLKK
jgi:glycosyltransferase involved in cell wall biosynthesis